MCVDRIGEKRGINKVGKKLDGVDGCDGMS